MRLLYVTSDRSFWERARLELHGEGIETFESDVDPAMAAVGSPFMPRGYRLYVLHDADFARANEVLLRIGAAPSEPVRLPTGWWVRVAFFLVGLLAAAIAMLSART